MFKNPPFNEQPRPPAQRTADCPPVMSASGVIRWENMQYLTLVMMMHEALFYTDWLPPDWEVLQIDTQAAS